jgi:hypothetical protein
MVVALDHDELVRIEALLGDVPGRARAASFSTQTDALPLADGVEGKPDVLAKNAAVSTVDLFIVLLPVSPPPGIPGSFLAVTVGVYLFLTRMQQNGTVNVNSGLFYTC